LPTVFLPSRDFPRDFSRELSTCAKFAVFDLLNAVDGKDFLRAGVLGAASEVCPPAFFVDCEARSTSSVVKDLLSIFAGFCDEEQISL
jgi:hypothetical protein